MTAMRVLLLDDEAGLRQAYAWYLQSKGFMVDEAGTLDQALALVEQKTYHVALIDIILEKWNPENRDGFKVVAKLRELNEGTARIVLSQQDNLQLAADAVPKYGASSYLAKPTILKLGGLETLVSEVKAAAIKHKLTPFGARVIGKEVEWRSARSYLSSVQPILINQCLDAFRPAGGLSALNAFLEAFLTPLAPILPRKRIDSLFVLQETPFVCLWGEFWSKAEGAAVQLVICHTRFRDKVLSGECEVVGVRIDKGALKDEISSTGGDISGLVFVLAERNRNDYLDRLLETIGKKPTLPTV